MESLYQPLNENWNNILYMGNYWRFYWNNSPGAYIEYKNSTIELLPDYYYLIPPLVSFKGKKSANPWQFYYHFTLQDYKISPSVGPQPFPMTGDVKKRICKIIQELDGPPLFYSSKGFFQIVELTGKVLSNLEEIEQLSVELDDDLEKAIIYIHLNLNRNIQSDELASHVLMGRSTFFKEFKKYTGMSPNLFIRTIKMEVARHKITYSNISIKELSEVLGYTDRFHFSKTFKKHFGINPGQVQK
ncbi:AraC family transcriptional regulator [Oceanispirochaeta sp. M1]|uniref:helix-turn-helix domain-containing protein n=1 Tax=Oceanispirochaeta sp. M1 TaxID=2283433 RepID=UPI0014951D3B|nr:AraC family transcriptional regulator [Oceanispirochaeta sp. M1]